MQWWCICVLRVVLLLMGVFWCVFHYAGKQSSTGEPRLLIPLVWLCLRITYSSVTGPRWVWCEPTGSTAATRHSSIVPQSDQATLSSRTLCCNLLVRKRTSELQQITPVLWPSLVFNGQTFCIFSLLSVMNPCGRHNGGCQHICVLSHRTDNGGLGYRCKCRLGYDLQPDRRTCFSEFSWSSTKWADVYNRSVSQITTLPFLCLCSRRFDW